MRRYKSLCLWMVGLFTITSFFSMQKNSDDHQLHAEEADIYPDAPHDDMDVSGKQIGFANQVFIPQADYTLLTEDVIGSGPYANTNMQSPEEAQNYETSIARVNAKEFEEQIPDYEKVVLQPQPYGDLAFIPSLSQLTNPKPTSQDWWTRTPGDDEIGLDNSTTMNLGKIQYYGADGTLNPPLSQPTRNLTQSYKAFPITQYDTCGENTSRIETNGKTVWTNDYKISKSRTCFKGHILGGNDPDSLSTAYVNLIDGVVCYDPASDIVNDFKHALAEDVATWNYTNHTVYDVYHEYNIAGGIDQLVFIELGGGKGSLISDGVDAEGRPVYADDCVVKRVAQTSGYRPAIQLDKNKILFALDNISNSVSISSSETIKYAIESKDLDLKVTSPLAKTSYFPKEQIYVNIRIENTSHKQSNLLAVYRDEQEEIIATQNLTEVHNGEVALPTSGFDEGNDLAPGTYTVDLYHIIYNDTNQSAQSSQGKRIPFEILNLSDAQIQDDALYQIIEKPNKNGWYNTEVQIQPIHDIFNRIRLNDEIAKEPHESLILGEGIHEADLYFYNSENAIVYRNRTFSIDTTAPSIPTATIVQKNTDAVETFLDNISFQTEDVTKEIIFRSEDALSGIAYLEYKEIGANEHIQTLENNTTLEYPEGINIMYSVRAIDQAGNASMWSEPERILVDHDFPILEGIQDTESYYLPRKIVYYDATSKAEAYVNDHLIHHGDLIIEPGSYQIAVYDEAEHKIEVSFQILPLPNISDCSIEELLTLEEKLTQEFISQKDILEAEQQEEIETYIKNLQEYIAFLSKQKEDEYPISTDTNQRIDEQTPTPPAKISHPVIEDKLEKNLNIQHLNLDFDNDGKPDINIDADGDGVPEINIDTTGDGIADFNLDINQDGKAEVNIGIVKYPWNPAYCQERDGINYCTDTKLKPIYNIDTTGDGKADLNILEASAFPTLNVDVNNDKIADVNLDVEGNLQPTKNLDRNHDGIIDQESTPTSQDETNLRNPLHTHEYIETQSNQGSTTQTPQNPSARIDTSQALAEATKQLFFWRFMVIASLLCLGYRFIYRKKKLHRQSQ